VFLDGLFPCDVYAAGCVPPAHVAFRSDAFYGFGWLREW
jgi:NADH:ubiquinone oxidoreductase subunit B-like Fe-S oxidoreductase